MKDFLNDVKNTANGINNFIKFCITEIKCDEDFDCLTRIFEFEETKPLAVFTELGIASILVETVEKSEKELNKLGYEFSFDIFKGEDGDAIVKVYVTKKSE